jgi:hypothetical protein
MKSLPWKRSQVITDLREQIWMYLTPHSDPERQVLDAAALLQMDEADLLALSRVHFVLSPEVRDLLDEVPSLLRRLPTTSVHGEEESAERIRGAIHWPLTVSRRVSGASHNVYVTRPAHRAFDTPENQLLVFLLKAISTLGQRTGWASSQSESSGRLVSSRTALADRWLASRMLQSIPWRPPTPRSISRIVMGRHRRRFQLALDAYSVYQRLIEHLSPDAIRETIEQRGLATRADDTLFEVLVLFRLIDALRTQGWNVPHLGVFRGHLHVAATRTSERLELWYQTAPLDLRKGSEYTSTLAKHDFSNPLDLRPDFTLRLRKGSGVKWLMVEAKMGERRTVDSSARQALVDLLAYQQAFSLGIAESEAPTGLGVAWGAELVPVLGRQMLATPDRLVDAIQLFGAAFT